MKIVFISDTHGKHKDLQLPDGDVLVHAGDLSPRGSARDLQEFFHWFETRPHAHKICIAGNHDFLAEDNPEMFAKLVPDNVIYLNDSGCEIEGVKFWGSPITPWFYDWAFNRKRGEEIARYWSLIPEDTDVLITHGPPYGILDKTARGDLAGCEELLRRVEEVQPKIHVFGHIHEARGAVKKGKTQFVNASVLNLMYMLVFDPQEYSL
ncbi:MAG: metallophosphatase domain-containing protein [Bacteroidia bacterium]|nr:metallophosphatase domain-containing protein [Bacteroidia bacterium]